MESFSGLSMNKMFFAGAGMLTAVIGGWDFTLRILLILILVDILTGIFKALYLGKFTSKEFRQGMITKAGYIIVIILCNQLDVLAHNSAPVIRTIGTVCYIGVEGSSIIENLGEMGVYVPDFIKNRFGKFKEDTPKDIEIKKETKETKESKKEQ